MWHGVESLLADVLADMLVAVIGLGLLTSATHRISRPGPWGPPPSFTAVSSDRSVALLIEEPATSDDNTERLLRRDAVLHWAAHQHAKRPTRNLGFRRQVDQRETDGDPLCPR